MNKKSDLITALRQALYEAEHPNLDMVEFQFAGVDLLFQFDEETGELIE